MFVESTLWRVFIFIASLSLLLASSMLYLKWTDIKKETFTQLVFTNNLVQNTMGSILKHQETVLSILGKRLMENKDNYDQEQLRHLVNEMLIKNPATAGFGLADLQGNLILTSSNLKKIKLPNLLEKEETADSFRKALSQDGMVIGRSYYLEAAKKWIVPSRFRIKDDNQNIIAVMTTGFELNSEHSPWNDRELPENVDLLIVKKENQQFYRQFISGIPQSQYGKWIGKPIPELAIKQYGQDLYQQHQLTLDEISQSESVLTTESYEVKGDKILNTVQYNEEYDLYTMITQKTSTLYPQLIPTILWLSTLLILFNTTLLFLFNLVSKIQQRSKKSLEFQATHDALTKLPNRHYFNNLQDFSDKPELKKATLLFIDLSKFKATNDLYGHRTGDLILMVVADRLRESFVENTIVRFGGDEFIVVLENEEKKVIPVKAQHFLTHLNKAITIDEIEFNIGANIGSSHYPENGNCLDELLRKSDIAMYEAKRHKSSYFEYSSDLEKRQQHLSLLEKELSHAIEKNELFLTYQPQIDAETLKLSGLETLLRWNSKKLGFISPEEFIPIAESSGLIHDIGLFVLNQSIKDICTLCKTLDAEVREKIIPGDRLRLSVNVSVEQLFQKQFIQKINEAMRNYEMPDISLMVEITESLFIRDLDSAIEVMNKIKGLGTTISLDDFGTGYSSLSILNKLPIDELKIDKSFVQDILVDEQARTLVGSIINIGKNLSIPVLAEGVEEKEQADLLAKYGCDVFQGYYFSKPLTLEQLSDYIANYALHH